MLAAVVAGGLYLSFSTREPRNEFSSEANECLRMLQATGNVPMDAALAGEVKAETSSISHLKRAHLHISYNSREAQQDSKWELCVLAGKYVSHTTEALVADEITAALKECKQAVPCIENCGMRWAKYADPTEERTVTWRDRMCTRERLEEHVRQPTIQELSSAKRR